VRETDEIVPPVDTRSTAGAATTGGDAPPPPGTAEVDGPGEGAAETAPEPVGEAAAGAATTGGDAPPPPGTAEVDGPGEGAAETAPEPVGEAAAVPTTVSTEHSEDRVRGLVPGQREQPAAAGEATPESTLTNMGMFDRPDAPEPLEDTRKYGQGYLRREPNPEYQKNLAGTLRDSDGYAKYFNPATHPCRREVNDGGPQAEGRGNNCLDCSLAALSTFHGRPELSQPRARDVKADGTPDMSGEKAGAARAMDWLGGTYQQFDSQSGGYAQLHDQLSQLGPGSSALIINEWKPPLDPTTGSTMLDDQGTPLTNGGAHAWLAVNPADGSGPVWWDPQLGRAWADSKVPAYAEDTQRMWAMILDKEGRPL
jgi:hypothetical protein